MATERPFYPRRRVEMMGAILVRVSVENANDASKQIRSLGMVDTGAFGLILPTAWKETLEPLRQVAIVDLETADQRIIQAEVCGPLLITVDGFRQMLGEAVFVEMEPGRDGRHEPLVGYTVLESCGAVVDMVSHRLVARKYYDLKRLVA